MYAPGYYPGQFSFSQTTQTYHTYFYPSPYGMVPITVPQEAPVEPSLYDASGKIKPELRVVLNDVKEVAHSLFHTFYAKVKETKTPKFKNISLLNNCWFWDFSTTHQTIINPLRDHDRNDKNGRALIIIVAVVIAVITSYFLGKDIKQHQLAKMGLEAQAELCNKFFPYARQQNTNYDAKNIQQACEYSFKMFNEIRKHALRNLIIKIVIVAIAVVAVIGAAASSPEVLVAAGIAALVAAIAAMINKGFSYGHDTQILTYVNLLGHNPVLK